MSGSSLGAGKRKRKGGQHSPTDHSTGGQPDTRTHDLTGVDPDLAPRLVERLSPRRLWHSRQVADLAVSLARRWNLDADAARRAGLLHDVCRENRDEWPEMAAKHNVELPSWAEGNYVFLHGPLGAIVAEREFHLSPAWCEAIAHHTAGHPAMTREAQMLFIADHACEGRREPEVPHWRALAHEDLGAAVLELLTHRLHSLLESGHQLWLPTVLARNELLVTRRTPEA